MAINRKITSFHPLLRSPSAHYRKTSTTNKVLKSCTILFNKYNLNKFKPMLLFGYTLFWFHFLQNLFFDVFQNKSKLDNFAPFRCFKFFAIRITIYRICSIFNSLDVFSTKAQQWWVFASFILTVIPITFYIHFHSGESIYYFLTPTKWIRFLGVFSVLLIYLTRRGLQIYIDLKI